MGNINALVISVSSASERRAMQMRQLEKLDLSGDIMDAVTPDDVPISELDGYRFSWARPLSNGEIACALSHRKAWQYAVNSKEPILVLEDDVILSDDVAEVLKSLADGPDLGYVTLEFYGQSKDLGHPTPLQSTQYGLSRLYRDRGGAAAYVIWPKTAKRILDLQKQSLPLADAAINLSLGIKFYQLEPACAVQSNVLAREYSSIEDNPVTKAVANNTRPEYPSKLIYVKCKMRRLYCSGILFVKVIQSLGRSSKRFIKHTVTPRIIEES